MNCISVPYDQCVTMPIWWHVFICCCCYQQLSFFIFISPPIFLLSINGTIADVVAQARNLAVILNTPLFSTYNVSKSIHFSSCPNLPPSKSKLLLLCGILNRWSHSLLPSPVCPTLVLEESFTDDFPLLSWYWELADITSTLPHFFVYFLK